MMIYRVRQDKYNTELTIKTTVSQEGEDMLALRINRVYDNKTLAVRLTPKDAKEMKEVLEDYLKGAR